MYHTLGIAEAIRQKRPVAIFDAFIFNGVQSSDENVLPTAGNSIPLANVIDLDYLFGVISDYGIEATLLPADWDLPSEERVPCSGMVSLGADQSKLASDLLSAFRPSGILKELIHTAREALKVRGFDTSQGVCVHHRDGQDWHDHCARWGAIPDGIYRGNCLNETQQSFLGSLENRALGSDSRWIYYVGDHEVPTELMQSKYTVVTKDSFLDATAKEKLSHRVLQSEVGTVGPIRDLWSIVDFFVCDSLNYFVGNSVSSWSAVQVAVRQKHYRSRGMGTYWYNSQSIPLGDFLPLYEVPIAFVYTELSPENTKFLLQASVASIKEKMSRSRITVLYHGNDDIAFRTWLERKGVIIEQHYPEWRSDLAKATPTTRRLRPSDESLLQEYQRIDIPKYLESEYCLFLEPGFIVKRRFTLSDFGLDLTWSIAFLPQTQSSSSETSGISLLNVPRLRKTYGEFLGFVESRLEDSNSLPKGAIRADYDAFYKDTAQSLPRNFAFQPHEHISRQEAASSKALYFYDVLPHQYLAHVIGIEHDEITAARCRQALATSQLCRSVQEFARLLLQSGEPGLSSYCKASFPDNSRQRDYCMLIFTSLSSEDGHCDDLQDYVKRTIASARKAGKRGNPVKDTEEATWINAVAAARYASATNALVLCGLFGILAIALSRRRFGRKSSSTRFLRVWTASNILFSFILGHILINGVLLHRYSDSHASCP